MALWGYFARFDPRSRLRRELENVRSGATALALERNAYLQQRDRALGERDAYLQQRDRALAERDAYLQQRDRALGERDAYLRQRDEALGERNEFLRQRDEALGECNELLRQRDEEIGQKNLAFDRSARYAHRADVVMRPVVGTPQRLLLFLHLPKTGGVTIADILARNFTTEEFLQVDLAETAPSAIGTWSHAAIERGLARLQAPAAARLRAVWGHFGHGVQACLPAPCAVVTLLRDPVDRVLSAYFYSDDPVWRGLERLKEYLGKSDYHVGFDNGMCRILSGRAALDPTAPGPEATTENFPRVTQADCDAAAENLDEYLVVGTTDQFDQTLVVLGADLRWALSDLVYRPVNVTPSRLALADVPAELREKILAWNAYDAALVERARAHLARRIAAYRGDYQRDLSLFRRLNSLHQRGAPVEELRRIELEAHIADATELDGRRHGSPLHRASAR
jgi:hypothetical protein